MQELEPDVISILGIDVSTFASYDEALAIISRRIRLGIQTFCVAINPEKIYRAIRSAELHESLRSAHLRICDGIGICFASMLLHGRRIPRCTGIDLFIKLIHFAARENLNVFVLGASAETNEAGCRALRRTCPGLKIVGSHHGYFTNSADIVKGINDSEADLLFVALGSPRQELWIFENLPKLRVRFCMGIGGSLDVVSGAVARAPMIFRAIGAEWLHRLLSQPSRLRRQAALPV
ncbi:MAG: WecB/TagA/CpsF family glycosyltransferase, partial [Acidobacteriaceae bacterium]|nr:WecB/TagA/CpsF family glycosyltransferase [Acidobacteriaceae bacterium]